MCQSDPILPVLFLVSNDSSQNEPIEFGLHHMTPE